MNGCGGVAARKAAPHSHINTVTPGSCTAEPRTIGHRATALEQLKVKCPEVAALMVVVEGFKLPGFSQLLYYSDFKL